MMKTYCPQCNREQETDIINKVETYPVKGLDISVPSDVRVCSCCGEEIWDPELDDVNLRKAYAEYRDQKNLLTPEQIKSIRLQYKLSQTAFAKVLGLGKKTITRYENGSLQDEAQNNLIMLVSDPANFERLLRKNGNRLSDKEREYLDMRYLSIPPYRFKGEVIPYRFTSIRESRYTNCVGQSA